MDILREVMQRLLITAIKEKDNTRRDALRLVIADVDSDHKRKDDDKWAETVIRKHIKQNEEAISFYKEGDEGYARLKEQSGMLQSLLPKTLTVEQIEDELLNTGEGELKVIKGAKSEGQAMGIAMKHFKSKGLAVLGNDVKAAITHIRS